MSDHDTIEKIVAEMHEWVATLVRLNGKDGVTFAVGDWADRLASLRQAPEVVAVIGECAEVQWLNGGPCQLPPGARLFAACAAKRPRKTSSKCTRNCDCVADCKHPDKATPAQVGTGRVEGACPECGSPAIVSETGSVDTMLGDTRSYYYTYAPQTMTEFRRERDYWANKADEYSAKLRDIAIANSTTAQAGAELPELPEPAGVLVINGQALRGFTADQMREMYRRGLKDARLGGQ